MTVQLTVEDLHQLERDGSRWLDDARARLRLRLTIPAADTDEQTDE